MRVVASLLAVLFTACGSASRAPAGLAFDTPEHRIGALPPGEGAEVRVPWRRTGDGPLRVLAVRTDCGCAVAEPLPGSLPAGATGTLLLRLAPALRPGPFGVRARVYTAAPPPGDRLVVTIRGHVSSPLALRPASLDVGPRSPGAHVRRAVELRWDPTAFAARGLEARLTGLSGTVRLEPAAAGDHPGRLLRIDFRAPRKPGPFEGEVLLRQDGRVLASLPVRGLVLLQSEPEPATSRRLTGCRGRGPPR